MKINIYCFGCQSKLRVPKEGKGTVICPFCTSKMTINDGKIIKNVLSKNLEKPSYETNWSAVLIGVLVFVGSIIFFSFKDQAYDWYQSRKIEGSTPQIELKDGKIYFYNLQYTVGLTGINEVNTNLSEFNKSAWDLLRNSNGTYSVIRHIDEKDKYGNIQSIDQEFGTINVDELNRYQTFEDFEKAGGISAILGQK